MNYPQATDLTLIDEYCEKCVDFIDPRLFRELERRGLYNSINKLGDHVPQRKAIARARLQATGRYMGDPEIEQIADTIARIEKLKAELAVVPASEVHLLLPIVEQIKQHATFVKTYYATPALFWNGHAEDNTQD